MSAYHFRMTLQRITRRLALAATAAILAACGGATATGSPPAPGTQAPPPPSAEATQAALPSIGPDFSFTLPSEDKALEDLLPDDVGGAPISKASMAGDSLVGGIDSQIGVVVQGLGKTADDISAAFGTGGGVSITAYRLKGVPAQTLLQSFVTMLSGEDAPTVTDANVGGKAVKKAVSPDSTIYVYTKDDVLFTIVATPGGTDAAIAEAISKLP